MSSNKHLWWILWTIHSLRTSFTWIYWIRTMFQSRGYQRKMDLITTLDGRNLEPGQYPLLGKLILEGKGRFLVKNKWGNIFKSTCALRCFKTQTRCFISPWRQCRVVCVRYLAGNNLRNFNFPKCTFERSCHACLELSPKKVFEPASISLFAKI